MADVLGKEGRHMDMRSAIPVVAGFTLAGALLFSPPAPAPVIEFILDKDRPPQDVQYEIVPSVTDPEPSRAVRFFEDSYSKGKSFTLRAGQAIQNLHKKKRDWRHNWGDTISSLEVGGCTTVLLWENSDYRGTTISFKNTSKWDAHVNRMPSGWNDRVSGVSVLSQSACR